MFNAYDRNQLLIAMMETIAGDDVDVEAARAAFTATRGDFRAKFTAAVQAQLARSAVAEVFLELPDDPEQMRKADLEELVRAAPHGFLRSYPSKSDLVGQVAAIRRRQQQRPAWIPRITRDGTPVPPAAAEDERYPDRPLTITAFPQLGEITVLLPEAGPEEARPELVMAGGGIGEWESGVYALLGLQDGVPADHIELDAAANAALVPAEHQWWSAEIPHPTPAPHDPGVASELLATCTSVGSHPVTDADPTAEPSIVDALLAAGDWRYSPQWLLQAWDPGGTNDTITAAHAAVAGWADKHQSGTITYVFGGSLDDAEGLTGFPTPLHSYLLVTTRSPDGGDDIAAIHRLILSCPGEHWCHRGGCPETTVSETDALLLPIVAAAHAAHSLSTAGDHWSDSYQQFYGDCETVDSDEVLEILAAVLAAAGWAELNQSIWEGGLQERLLRRDRHCLTARYDPVTRQIWLDDGKAGLDNLLQMLTDDGVLVDDQGVGRIDASEDAQQEWGAGLLAAATDLLQGNITELAQPGLPVQATVIGLHPHGDGTLHGPDAATLVEHQLHVLLGVHGLLAG